MLLVTSWHASPQKCTLSRAGDYYSTAREFTRKRNTLLDLLNHIWQVSPHHRGFDVFFFISMRKMLNKQSGCRRFKTPWCSRDFTIIPGRSDSVLRHPKHIFPACPSLVYFSNLYIREGNGYIITPVFLCGGMGRKLNSTIYPCTNPVVGLVNLLVKERHILIMS